MKNPNILVLMADQLAAGGLSAYGNRITRTPHIDRLAERSVVFGSAYSNSPLCAPSRFSWMAGRLPSAIGAYDNAAEFASQVPTFGHYLRSTGYRTILTGKMHFCGPDQLHGFEERLTTDIYPADYGWTPDWTRFEERPSWYHTMDSVIQAGTCTRTNQIDFDEEVVFTARRKLFEIARGNDRRPFCMVVSLTHPHDPFNIQQTYWDRYRDDEIDLPRVPAEALDPHSRRLRHVINMDRQPVTPAQVRAARHAYYGAISFVDDQIGAVLGALRDARLAEDTIILLLADHGEMLGEHGLWYKMSYFEGACRIPLMIHAPGHFASGMVKQSVSLLDILPTVAELGGDGAAPDYVTPLDGLSLLPHLQRTGGHDEVIGEYLAEGAIAPVIMLRRGRWKFIHSPVDPDQLYDLAADPGEQVNLAETAAETEAFRAEVAQRWSLPALTEAVIASQRRRRFVAASLDQGKRTAWDYQPFQDSSQQYMRNHMHLDDLEAMARFPRFSADPA